MKELISICAIFILIMTFPVQYALNMKNHYSVSLMQKHVNNAKELSRAEGCFTDEIETELKKSIAVDFSIEEDEVIVDATNLNERKERGELIHYKVSAPIHKIIATNIFWGISHDENSGRYEIENFAVSEWVGE